MTHTLSFRGLTDRDLISEVKRLAAMERSATVALIASLAEMDARRLYLGEGCSSLFTYCTRVLHLSEHAAYGRIEAARAARRLPMVLERLERGELTLTNLCLLRPHLTDENCLDLLDAARHASKRDVERVVAGLAPRPDAPAIVRKLPATSAALTPVVSEKMAVEPPRAPVPPDSTLLLESSRPSPPTNVAAKRPALLLQPLAPGRYKVQFTVGRETHDKLRRAQDLLRHAVPDGDPAEIFDRALTVLLERLERSKPARVHSRPTSRPIAEGSRHIPASVRRAVWKRDEGRCAFEGTEGRCEETGFLEFHHLVPFARGGCAAAENIQLRCRAHNQHAALEDFGARALFTRETAPPYLVN
jgi:5-methylcytosine-specific restriction endonuclease McrA